MFKQATIYNYNSKIGTSKSDESLEAAAFVECGASQEISIGFVPPRGEEHGALAEYVTGQRILKVMIETRSVPGDAVRRKVDEEVKQIEASTGRKPGKKERREIAEDARMAMLPMTFSKRSAVLIWFEPITGKVVIDTTSRAKLDLVTSLLVRTIDGLTLSLVDTETAPSAAMAAWLSDSDTLHTDFTIDRECELKACDETKAVVRYAKHPLDIKEVAEHIKMGKMPTKLALTWKERVSFVLTDDLHLKKISFLDGVFENGVDRDNVDAFDADVAISTGELTSLMSDLMDVLGGESQTDSTAAGTSTTPDEDDL